MAVDRQSWVQHDALVINVISIFSEHAVKTVPVTGNGETLIHTLVYLVDWDEDLDHHFFRASVSEPPLILKAHHVNEVQIVEEHVVVPLIFHVSDLLVNALLTDILSNQLSISDFRVQEGRLGSWRCEAEFTI